MNKKIFPILLISIFLIVSIGLISAAEDGDDAGNASDPIKVKIVWDDNGNTTARPDKIMVNLLHGGKVVEFIELNESGSWNATFNTQSDSGNYKVKLADDLSNYSVSYNGSAESGFVIKCTLKETPVQKNDAKNATGNATNNDTKNQTDNNKTSNKTNDSTNNKTNNNKTNNTTNNKTNNNKINDKTKNQTNDNKAKENINNQTNKADNNTKNTINNIINKTNSTPKKEEPNNGTSMVTTSKRPPNYGEPEFSVNKLRNTGLPIIAVSLIAILGGYAYLRYRK